MSDHRIELTIRCTPTGQHTLDLRLITPNQIALLANDLPVPLKQETLRASDGAPLAYGDTLTRMLFQAPVATLAWAQAASAIASQPSAALTLLLDARDTDLHHLHWETLQDPLRLPDKPPETFDDPDACSPLALSERLTLSRTLITTSLGAFERPEPGDLWATVLVAGGRDLAQFSLPPIDVTAEVALSRDALGPIPTTILARTPDADGPPTLDALLDAVRRQPPILLIIGHGRAQGHDTTLYLEDDAGLVAPVSGASLVATLSGLATRPLLALLAACDSAGDGYGPALNALAPQLVAAGVPAVIAFQGSLASADLHLLLPVLLREIQRDGRVDRATAAIRRALLDRGAWWQPRLWLAIPDGRLWRRADPISFAAANLADGTEALPARTFQRLIGRDTQLHQIQEALAGPHRRAVAILGLGGMGKTALAREVADRSADRFAQILWASAQSERLVGEHIRAVADARYDIDGLLQLIGRQLGLRQADTMPADDLRATIAALVRSRPTLLILDNLETVDGHEALVAAADDLIAGEASQSRLLITSRHEIRHEALFQMRLPPLDPQSAIELIREDAQLRGVVAVAEADDDVLAQIVEATGAAPLALRLIVGQLASQPLDLTLDSLREASADGPNTDFYRYLYRRSWDLIDDTARITLVCLSAFPPVTGGLQNQIQQVVATDFAIPPRAVSAALAQLVRSSLVDRHGALGRERYALHPLTYYFVRSDIAGDWAV